MIFIFGSFCVVKWKLLVVSYFSYIFGVRRWGGQESVIEVFNNREKFLEKGVEVRLLDLDVMDLGFWFIDDNGIQFSMLIVFL